MALLWTAASCGDNRPPAEPDTGVSSAQKEIGPEGGFVELAGARIDVPPGALAAPTTLTLTRTTLSAPAGHEAYSPVYEFGPEDAVLRTPVTVSLPVESDDPDPVIYWQEEDDDLTDDDDDDPYLPLEEADDNDNDDDDDDDDDNDDDKKTKKAKGKTQTLSKGYSGKNNPCGRDLKKDNDNCGSCGRSCNNSSHVVSCREGVCEPECDDGLANCDGKHKNGCEVDTRGDPDNCGGCGVQCGDRQECVADEGIYSCQCGPGYVYDSGVCVDVDECGDGSATCDPNATCSNTQGGYDCTCRDGYEGDGKTCADVDECVANLDDCHANARCANTPGSFECACDTGFDGDGRTCTDVDECAAGIDDCAAEASCTNTPGGFECTCDAGYQGDGRTCADIDECTTGTHACSADATCGNTVGGYDCSCNPGFSGDGVLCTDIDECAAGIDACDERATCQNLPGSYDCACGPGYAGDGWSCVDVDECADNSHTCDDDAVCANTDGGYDCSCAEGFQGDGRTCDDVDECAIAADDCADGATCSNLPGSFACTCPAGFAGDGRTCEDVDECASGSHTCSDDAACDNTAGGYTCACLEGFTGDGFVCIDIDECTDGSHACDGNALCTNTAGSYQCSCDAGYAGDGAECFDSARTVVDIEAGGAHTCARLDSGHIRCWGWGIYGQLGYANTDSIGDDEAPGDMPLVDVGGEVADLALGVTHGCAILTTGDVRCWGRNHFGPLGYGHADDVGDDEHPSSQAPIDVGAGIQSIAGGGEHTCAVVDGGAVRCWGLGIDGQLGYGNTDPLGDDEAPGTGGDVELGAPATQVVAGRDHSCALLEDGRVRCWGRGTWAPLGLGHTRSIGDDELASAAPDVDVGGTAVHLAAGWYHTCALLDTGAVRCWGYGGQGQLGYGNTRSIGDDEAPASAGDVRLGGRAVQLTAGTYHTCALLDTGAVRCWGQGKDGQLGYASKATVGDNEHPDSVGVVEVGRPVTKITAGSYHTCALLDNGAVRCWGRGEHGLCYGNTDTIGDDEAPLVAGDCQILHDEDECALGLDDCAADATCTNRIDGYDCTCNDGFTGDGKSCNDVDECALGLDDCTGFERCTNEPGSYSCSDIDECADGTAVCDVNATCENGTDGYTCSCNEGWTGDGQTCGDADECADGSHACSQYATCANTVGGYDCTCGPGFEGDGRSCADIDECALGQDDCGANATCVNEPGGFTCECDLGYEGDGQTCTDVDECVDAATLCPAPATCDNLPGGFACSGGCPVGFSAIGGVCVDVDECADGSHTCSPDAVCTNNVGGFSCACGPGFEGDGQTCTDIDECATGAAACGDNATCNNSAGSFTCDCDDGYAGDGYTCADIDECADGSAGCDPNATCANTEGGYTCTCNAPLTGDGTSCTDVDECAEGTHDCGANATCTNTLEGWSCACDEGYQGDGKTCGDIDECATGTASCATNATCTNTEGSFECACGPNFDGDGTSCNLATDCMLLDDFDTGVWPGPWQLSSGGAAPGTLAADAAHTGAAGLRDADQLMRHAGTSFGADGDVISVWFRAHAGSGRARLGFAASTSGMSWLELDAAAGTLSFGHRDGGFDEIQNQTAHVFAPEAWYYVEVEMMGGSTVEARVHHGDDLELAASLVWTYPDLAPGTAGLLVDGDASVDTAVVCTTAVDETMDECALGVDTCDANATCIDQLAGYSCECNAGFSGDGFTCADANECADGTSSCSPDATCTDIVGGYTCACNDGFSGDGFLCTDDDECALGTDTCDANASCQNTAGSYECLCDSGFEGDGWFCDDIDECGRGLDGCDPNATCTNTPGNYECACDEGYDGDGFTCVDIDECAQGLDSCSNDALCVNTEGSYDCYCFEGYEGNGFLCDDVDECDRGADNCNANATCSNTPGSFSCACNPGYTGAGVVCFDIDECATGTDTCANEASCANNEGGFDCICDPGYSGDGYTCSDIDECALGIDGCDDGAMCENTVGSYECVCGRGFAPSGESCVDIATRVHELAAGRLHTCALMNEGVVRCWGSGAYGQLGYGNTANVGDDEPAAAGGHVYLRGAATQVAAGADHTCALFDDGGVSCWGLGGDGRLGTGATASVGDDERPGDRDSIDLGGAATQISAGAKHTCALMTGGAVRCWGDNLYGQLGYGHGDDIGDDETPATAGDVPLGGTAVSVAAGDFFTCALLDTGAVRCWGLGGSGQLGYGTHNSVGLEDTPAEVGDVDVGGAVTQLAAGANHVCALLDTGALRCWGQGSYGRLGYGNTFDVGDDETPANAGDVSVGGVVSSVSAGYYHTCALVDGVGTRCWGLAISGQLGYGNSWTVGDNELPTAVGSVDVGGAVSALAAGDHHTCAVLTDATAVCWGMGSKGQLGYGTTHNVGDNELPTAMGPLEF